ncbi:uncharacterized protein M6B38_276660 [Iris pallida]|uniref:Uncharacterized protein n=1 Tax=Iris pallida TaxID=29817 RepID=A0AAX6I3F9_IRIPA|nr:uncharacterized protein M6B38_198385 [Iris pallida]KAJ6847628.1 uncharacterized protein M6B38_276660 [Iris pallida]
MLLHIALVHCNSLAWATTSFSFRHPRQSRIRADVQHQHQLHLSSSGSRSPSAIPDSLKVLQWNELCDSVSSFASTPLGRKASLSQLSAVADVSFEDSKKLLAETAAAIQLIDYGAPMDFAELDLVLVKLAIEHASRGFPVGGLEAMAVATLLQFAHTLQIALETAAKEDTDCYNNFMPLAQVILDAIISRQLVKSILQVVDDDGSVKDSAVCLLRPLFYILFRLLHAGHNRRRNSNIRKPSRYLKIGNSIQIEFDVKKSIEFELRTSSSPPIVYYNSLRSH